MKHPQRVLCLGGGWAAFELAKSLKPAIRRNEVELTVLSRGSYLATHGLMAEMLTCKVQPQQMLGTLAPLLAPGTHLAMEVVKIDIVAKTVIAKSTSDGSIQALPYDQLVLALGSVDDPTQIVDGTEHSFALKTFEDGCRLRSHLIGVLAAAARESDPKVRRELLTFVVAGGNYTGIEVACELVDYVRHMLRPEIANDVASGPRVIVIEKGLHILADLAERAPHMARYADRQVKRLGVEVMTGRSLVAVSPCGATLSDGGTVAARTVIKCTGTAACPQIVELPFALDSRGRLVTDEFMRVSGFDRVWAAGDCAAVPHPDGGTCPPMALFAREGGKLIGRNIIRELRGQKLLPNRFAGLGEACTLGHRCAVAQMKGFPAYGLAAWLGWRMIVWTMFAPGWRRKLSLAHDWLATAVHGRDTADSSIGSSPSAKRLRDRLGSVAALFL